MFKISRMLIVSLLVVMIAVPAFATTSRVAALGGASSYLNDDSDVFRWYGTLPSYSRIVMAEAGVAMAEGGPTYGADARFQALGFTHDFGEDHWLGTWGIFLLMNNVEDGSFYLFNPLVTPGGAPLVPGGMTSLQPVQSTKFVLTWGQEIEDLFSFGVQFTRSERSSENEPAAIGDIKSSLTTLGGGVRVDVGDDAYADIAVTYGSAGGDLTVAPVAPATTPQTGDLWETSTTFDVEGRLFWEWMDDVTIVGVAQFTSWDFLTVAQNASLTNNGGSKGTNILLGMSLDMDVNTNNMLIFATEVEFGGYEPSKLVATDVTRAKEVSRTVLPTFRVALESDINSWLTTRVGAAKMMTRMETTYATVTGDRKLTTTGSFSSGSDFQWTLGAGFHVGDWDLDVVLSDDMPFRMGYWITGYGTGDNDPPIARASGTYRF
jgi:hypothetical protein